MFGRKVKAKICFREEKKGTGHALIYTSPVNTAKHCYRAFDPSMILNKFHLSFFLVKVRNWDYWGFKLKRRTIKPNLPIRISTGTFPTICHYSMALEWIAENINIEVGGYLTMILVFLKWKNFGLQGDPEEIRFPNKSYTWNFFDALLKRIVNRCVHQLLYRASQLPNGEDFFILFFPSAIIQSNAIW